MLGAFEYSLLKFDVGYPTGEKHKGFGAFALNSVSLSNLLAAEVRIKDYGDKANQDVAERFGVSTEKAGLPETILFKRQEGGKVEEVARYGGDYTMASLRLFLASKAGLSITMEGCIKELDQLAQMFSQAGSKEEREKILFSAESWAKEAEDKETAKVRIFLIFLITCIVMLDFSSSMSNDNSIPDGNLCEHTNCDVLT